MKLLDLPSELLQEIMKHTVVATSFSRAFRLRLVNSMYQTHQFEQRESSLTS